MTEEPLDCTTSSATAHHRSRLVRRWPAVRVGAGGDGTVFRSIAQSRTLGWVRTDKGTLFPLQLMLSLLVSPVENPNSTLIPLLVPSLGSARTTLAATLASTLPSWAVPELRSCPSFSFSTSIPTIYHYIISFVIRRQHAWTSDLPRGILYSLLCRCTSSICRCRSRHEPDRSFDR